MALVLMPDAVGVLVDYLLTVSDVTDLIGDGIGDELPPEDALTLPFVMVQRIGGQVVTRYRYDGALIQVDVWDEPGQKERCSRTAETVRAALHAGINTVISDAVIGGVDEAFGPSQVEDPESERPRWTFRATVRMHPSP